MGIRGAAVMATSGVLVRGDPLRWWVVLLAAIVVIATYVASTAAVAHMSAAKTACLTAAIAHATAMGHASTGGDGEEDGSSIVKVALLAVMVVIALLMADLSISAQSSNMAAIESRYGVSDIRQSTGDGMDINMFAGASKSFPVTFRDSRGTHRGHVAIKGDCAVLYVGPVSSGTEYNPTFYGYSDAPVKGIAAASADGAGTAGR